MYSSECSDSTRVYMVSTDTCLFLYLIAMTSPVMSIPHGTCTCISVHVHVLCQSRTTCTRLCQL